MPVFSQSSLQALTVFSLLSRTHSEVLNPETRAVCSRLELESEIRSQRAAGERRYAIDDSDHLVQTEHSPPPHLGADDCNNVHLKAMLGQPAVNVLTDASSASPYAAVLPGTPQPAGQHNEYEEWSGQDSSLSRDEIDGDRREAAEFYVQGHRRYDEFEECFASSDDDGNLTRSYGPEIAQRGSSSHTRTGMSIT